VSHGRAAAQSWYATVASALAMLAMLVSSRGIANRTELLRRHITRCARASQPVERHGREMLDNAGVAQVCSAVGVREGSRLRWLRITSGHTEC